MKKLFAIALAAATLTSCEGLPVEGFNAPWPCWPA